MGSKNDYRIELQTLPLGGYVKIMFLLLTPTEYRKCDSGDEVIAQVWGSQFHPHRVLCHPAEMPHTKLCFKYYQHCILWPLKKKNKECFTIKGRSHQLRRGGAKMKVTSTEVVIYLYYYSFWCASRNGVMQK